MKSYFLVAVLLLSAGPGLVAQRHELVKKWETDSVFKWPESVLFDAKDNVLYVSNIDGDPWGKDGKGSIGKMGTDGKVIAVEWVTGLNGPKGLGLYDGKLYAADIDNVVVIDISKAAIEKLIPVPGSSGLNDITVDEKGVVYVSDSKTKQVFRIENGKPSLLLEGLKGPNGLLSRGNDFYVLDDGGMYKMGSDHKLTMIADGMEGGTDGIENVQGDDFLVSSWGGVIYYVHADGTKEKLLDTRDQKKNSADIGFDPKTRTVYVPTFFKNSVVAYEVK